MVYRAPAKRKEDSGTHHSVPDDSDYHDTIIETEDGCIITIDVSPGGKNERFPDGYNPWRRSFGVMVKAPAVEGKANKAIIELISNSLHLSRNAVSIVSGMTSSIKKVKITGISRNEIIAYFSERLQ